MNINMKIRFLNPPVGRDEVNERAAKDGMDGVGMVEVLCFRHAVHAAAWEGRDIKIEIDDFSSEYDGRTTRCERCEAGDDD